MFAEFHSVNLSRSSLQSLSLLLVRGDCKRGSKWRWTLPVSLMPPTAHTIYEVPGHGDVSRLRRSFALHPALWGAYWNNEEFWSGFCATEQTLGLLYASRAGGFYRRVVRDIGFSCLQSGLGVMIWSVFYPSLCNNGPSHNGILPRASNGLK